MNGGYFPTEWGWAAIAFLLLALGGLLVRERLELGVPEAAAVAALAAFTAWVALSTVWSVSAAQPLLEAERDLVYAAAVAALVVVTPRRAVAPILAGLAAGIVAVSAYALATRLVPDRVGAYDPSSGYQLGEPFGYWNALALYAAIGILLVLGFAAHARAPAARAAAAASLIVLAPTLYFTFSRGGWLALVAGTGVVLALDSRRARLSVALVAAGLPAAGAVWLASRSNALTKAGAPLSAAAHDGHRVALALLPLALGAALLSRIEPRPRVPRRLRWALAAAAAVLAVAGAVAFVVREGGPSRLLGNAVAAFDAPVRPEDQGDLNRRLVSLSGKNRGDYWRVAWHEYRDAPILGTGAGSFDRFWRRDRTTNFYARNAHNLYLETLAELGPIGLLLLVAALGTPLYAALRARGAPQTPVAAGAYTAFLLHAAIDWDWQVTGVTLSALVCGTALLVSARRGHQHAISGRLRAVSVMAAAPLLAFVVVLHVGNTALAAADRDLDKGRLADAAAQARRARHWAPWSFEPWQRLGEAQLRRGDAAAARASFREALKRDRLDSTVWLDLAVASRGSARQRALEEARRLDPRSAEIAVLAGG